MVAASIFGFFYADTGRRKYTSSYVELARKQGKTFLAALFCLFALIADGEDAAEVLLAANSKEQARIAFEIILVHAAAENLSIKSYLCRKAQS